MVRHCQYCNARPAKVLRPKNLLPVCLECFFELFENEVHLTITEGKIFSRGERVAIGASGGKDSTVLIHVLQLLNRKFDYGLDLQLLSIDEGIKGTPGSPRLPRRLARDRQEKPAGLRPAAHHHPLQRPLRLDDGRGRRPDRPEEQLHVLRRLQATGPREVGPSHAEVRSCSSATRSSRATTQTTSRKPCS